RISGKGRRDRKAPPFIGVVVSGSGAHGKSRKFVEKEVQAMIVVDDNRDIRPNLVEPCVYRLVSVEERIPKWIALQTTGDRFADRRNMGRCNASNNLGHDLISSRPNQQVLELVFGHATLLRADLLHV